MSLAADDKEGQARVDAFVQGLRELGWIDGRNVQSIFAGRQVGTAFAKNTLRSWSRYRPMSCWPPAAAW
jgi:hypothetical protein